jgi:hypothetical protein
MLSRIKWSESQGYLKAGDANTLNASLDIVSECTKRIDVAYSVREPVLFDIFIKAALFIYFVLWFPFVLWIRVGFMASLIGYPIVMFMTNGVVILRSWLGDPFDPKRPIQLVNYYAWKRQWSMRIHDKYNGVYTNE